MTVARGAVLHSLAVSGQHAPGTPDGVLFSDFSFSAAALNDASETAFAATLIGTGVYATNNSGIWADRSNSLDLVVRAGEHAPGTQTGVNFSSFLAPVLNNQSHIAFQAQLTSNGEVESMNDAGIWSDHSGSLALVARKGSQAPDTPAGLNFKGFGNLALNDRDQIAFLGILPGDPTQGTVSSQGIWASDTAGVLHCIVRSGDRLEIAPGVVGKVLDLDFTGGASSFNNLGQVVFQASFTDGHRGVFLSNAVAVPEPRAIFTVVMGAVGLSFHRRKRNSWGFRPVNRS